MSARVQQRQTYLDILRVLASFLICYNHAFGYHLFLEQEPNGSLISWINVFLSAVTSINIPLFFMISGALLLGKNETYGTILRKRVLRIVVLLFAAVILTHFIIVPGTPVPESVSLFLNGTNTGVYWYLFAYLGFLLILPMIRHMAQHMTQSDMIALVVLRTLFLPGLMTLNFWLDHWGLPTMAFPGTLQIPLALTESFFYPIAGYYLAQKLPMEKIGPKQVWLCVAVFLTGTMLATVMAYVEGYYRSFTQNYIRMFNYTSAMSLFVVARYAMSRITLPQRLERFFAAVSSVTIGIYFLEPLAGTYLYEPFFGHVPWTDTAITLASCAWCVVCMTVGGTTTWLLRKIPGVKKFL